MLGKVLTFAAGFVLAAGIGFGLVQTDTIQIYDDELQVAAWCRGYVDGTSIIYTRMTGLPVSAEDVVAVEASCNEEMATLEELPAGLKGPVE